MSYSGHRSEGYTVELGRTKKIEVSWLQSADNVKILHSVTFSVVWCPGENLTHIILGYEIFLIHSLLTGCVWVFACGVRVRVACGQFEYGSVHTGCCNIKDLHKTDRSINSSTNMIMFTWLRLHYAGCLPNQACTVTCSRDYACRVHTGCFLIWHTF